MRMTTFPPLYRTAAAKPAQQAPPTAQPRASLPVRWALYGFVISLAFELPDRILPFEVSTITGSILLLVTLTQPRLCYGRRPWAVWLFGAYAWAFWLSFVLGGGEHPQEVQRLFLFVLQGTLIFWAASNIMRNEEVARHTLYALIAACGLLALFVVVGAADVTGGTALRRVSALGQNTNRTARVLMVGLLAFLGLAYGRDRKLGRQMPFRWLVWPTVMVIGLAIVSGGSRGGLLALAAGLWVFTLGARNMRTLVRNSIVALVALVLLGWAASQSPLMVRRFERARAGDLAGREEIFPKTFTMMRERPLTGWGPIENQYELARRLDVQRYESRDTHNLVLEVFSSTGLVGGIPFFAAIILCLLAAWRSRHGPHGIVPLAVTFGLLAGSMVGNYLTLKIQWLMLAYALASTAWLVANPRKVERKQTLRFAQPGQRFGAPPTGAPLVPLGFGQPEAPGPSSPPPNGAEPDG
jgi:O-antigen ligase